MLRPMFLAFIIQLVLLCSGAEKLKLPSNIEQRQYCFGCIATVTEMERVLSKRLPKKGREERVIELMENICFPANFVKYEYSPPKTSAACKLLFENHEEAIETAFVKDLKDREQYICHQLSRACEGIDTTEKRDPSSNADIDLSGEGDEISRTVKIDPTTGKAEHEPKLKKKTKEEKGGKTMSKKDRKKKQTKENKNKSKDSKKEKSGEKREKGGLHHMNVDINDPASMDKVMEQIKEFSKKKEEL